MRDISNELIMEDTMNKTKILKDYKEKIKSVFDIDNTYWNGKKSENSFSFVVKGKDQPREVLKDKSALEKKEVIKQYIEYALEAIREQFYVSPEEEKILVAIMTGEGCEWKKIRSIHSSSLCGFLHFKNVSEETPIYINNEKYTKAFFEFENDCIDNPSSVDLVLTNKETLKVLFIELKFSEYLTPGSVKISNKYLKYYEKIFKKDNLLGQLEDSKKVHLFDNVFIQKDEEYGYFDMVFDKNNKDGGVYLGGIKQVISHFIGINNFNLLRDEEKIEKVGFVPKEISYAEILFELDGSEEMLSRFDKYYGHVVKVIKESGEYPNISIVRGGKTNVLKYSDIFEDDRNQKLLSDEVIKLYY